MTKLLNRKQVSLTSLFAFVAAIACLAAFIRLLPSAEGLRSIDVVIVFAESESDSESQAQIFDSESERVVSIAQRNPVTGKLESLLAGINATDSKGHTFADLRRFIFFYTNKATKHQTNGFLVDIPWVHPPGKALQCKVSTSQIEVLDVRSASKWFTIKK